MMSGLAQRESKSVEMGGSGNEDAIRLSSYKPIQ